MNLTNELLKSLKELYSDDGEERGGYINKKGEFIEVVNNHETPMSNFMFGFEDLDILAEDGIATVHTHPNGTSNLSKDDYDSFLNWWELEHIIVGNDGVSCYKVTDGGSVVKCS